MPFDKTMPKQIFSVSNSVFLNYYTYLLSISNTRRSPKDNNMKIVPLGDRVVLEPVEKEKGGKRESGLYLPETVNKERPEQGKVVAVGPGKLDDKGKRIPMGVKKGDVVLFTKYGPNEIKVDEKEYLIAREEDILAILE